MVSLVTMTMVMIVRTSSLGSMSLKATTDMIQPKRGCSNSLEECCQPFWPLFGLSKIFIHSLKSSVFLGEVMASLVTESCFVLGGQPHVWRDVQVH